MIKTNYKKTAMLADLTGQIERITYTNEENGYTIAKIWVRGQKDLITIAGNIISPTPGETIQMQGTWINHPKYGEQFNVRSYKTSIPASIEGIEKYLGSGLIKGIGPKMAGRIVKAFGEETLEIIGNKTEKLTSVEGIGVKRIQMIKDAWEEQKHVREVMIFLQSQGIGSGYATKIFKQYGDKSVQIMQENPYRLATDIFGIGFLTADRIAEKLGFEKNASMRIEAGILFVLHKLADDGHVYYPYEPLVKKCEEILEVDKEDIKAAIGAIAYEKKIIIEDLNDNMDDYRENYKAVFLAKYHVCETGITDRIKTLLEMPKSIREPASDNAIAWVQTQLSVTLAENQKKAITSAIENKVLVITGGPGTGKTTIINGIIKLFARHNVKTILCAPTGRAAKRMSETTGVTAKTIHRMLEYSFRHGGFKKNHTHPLDCDLIIVDESSMIDTILMYHLTGAIPDNATVILVGDVNQLPSVGAGNVLKDIISSKAVPVVELNEIFRQALESKIVVAAHNINKGKIPSLKSDGPGDDFYFIEQNDPEILLKTILELVKTRIPNYFRFDPINDIQVLSPMHKGVVGTGNLNTELQNLLNPGLNGINRGNRTYRINDKIMQIRNNYDKDVFNGDMGRIISIDHELHEIICDFEGREIVYGFSELDEISLSYAISVHKSQGSEYPVVIIPIHTQHYILMQRNLLYTALTRGKKLVIIVGDKKALAIAVKNDKIDRRYSYLKYRLVCI